MCPGPWTIWTDRTMHRVPKRYHEVCGTERVLCMESCGFAGRANPQSCEFRPFAPTVDMPARILVRELSRGRSEAVGDDRRSVLEAESHDQGSRPEEETEDEL